MKRALIVVVVALLIASVSGVTETSLALEREQTPQAASTHEQEIAERAAKIGVSRVVRIERADGTESNALLEDILPDAIVVTILDGQDRRRETISLTDIRRINEVRGHTLRNVLIGVGIGMAVLIGTCAAAVSSDTAPRFTP